MSASPRREFCTYVGRRIREARRAMGVGSADFADMVGMRSIDMVRVERGDIAPTAYHLSAIADALYCHVADLLPPPALRPLVVAPAPTPKLVTKESTPRAPRRTLGVRQLERERRRQERDGITITTKLPDVGRPKTRADCVSGVRPCPWVSCRHHLYLEVGTKGSLKINHPTIGPDELAESCALDVADRGGVSLQDVGNLVDLTRERVRQIEERALGAMRGGVLGEFRDWAGVDGAPNQQNDDADIAYAREPSTQSHIGTSEDVRSVEAM